MVIRSFLNNYDELRLHYLCELDTKSQSKRFLFGMVSKLYLRLVIALMCFCSHCCISCYQGPVCLLENSFHLESEFRESIFRYLVM